MQSNQNIPTIQCGIGNRTDRQFVLKIKNCSDSGMWYSGFVGKYVPFVRQLLSENCFMSREKEGYTNIVKVQDAELIEIVGDEIDYIRYY